MKTQVVSRERKAGRPAGGVRAVERSLAILTAFSPERSERSLEEISRSIELPKSTTHRLLQTLSTSGFVEPGRKPGAYRLGLQAVAIGRIAAYDRRPEEGVSTVMRALRDDADEAVGLSVIEKNTVIVVAKEVSRHPLSYNLGVGAVLPAYCTASGKVLLADLPDSQINRLYPAGRMSGQTNRTIVTIETLKSHLQQVRHRGYAIDNEELADGLRCVAVPIRDFSGRVSHALGVSGPSARLSLDRLRELVEPLMAASRQISVHMSMVA